MHRISLNSRLMRWGASQRERVTTHPSPSQPVRYIKVVLSREHWIDALTDEGNAAPEQSVAAYVEELRVAIMHLYPAVVVEITLASQFEDSMMIRGSDQHEVELDIEALKRAVFEHGSFYR